MEIQTSKRRGCDPAVNRALLFGAHTKAPNFGNSDLRNLLIVRDLLIGVDFAVATKCLTSQQLQFPAF